MRRGLEEGMARQEHVDKDLGRFCLVHKLTDSIDLGSHSAKTQKQGRSMRQKAVKVCGCIVEFIDVPSHYSAMQRARSLHHYTVINNVSATETPTLIMCIAPRKGKTCGIRQHLQLYFSEKNTLDNDREKVAHEESGKSC
jgi:hypothetical protein